MARENYDEILAELNKNFIDMGAEVENAFYNAGLALFNNDTELARKVIENDSKINKMEDDLQAECVNIIATQQPMASDLRFITTILSMIADLERIGDQAADISDITLLLGGGEGFSQQLKEMYKVCFSMLKDSLNSYVSKDHELAKEVAKRDDEVDAMFEESILNYETAMRNNPDDIDRIVQTIFVAKYLERIADHATNIAEGVIYYITGRQKRLN